MAADKLDPQQALLRALGHPMRKTLLKLCLEAAEKKSPKELALATYGGKCSFQAHLSSVSYHMRTLAEYGALEVAGEEPRRGAVAHFYRPSKLARETPWVVDVLNLPPLSEELRARIDEHIAERRKDKEFMARLNDLTDEHRQALDRLQKGGADERSE
jgi:DNA-binding transcriptional ArsR family regulator